MSFDFAPREPLELTAGDTVRWVRADLRSVYAQPGDALAYVFRGPDGAGASATADADFRVTLAGAVTAGWAAGRWAWQARVTRSGETVTVGAGELRVLPRLDALPAGADLRSHARRVLEAIEATIEGVATREHRSVTLADGRAIEHMSMRELLAARDHYRAAVLAEEQAALIAAGRAGKRRIWAQL